jgi:hypothetical protein
MRVRRDEAIFRPERSFKMREEESLLDCTFDGFVQMFTFDSVTAHRYHLLFVVVVVQIRLELVRILDDGLQMSQCSLYIHARRET